MSDKSLTELLRDDANNEFLLSIKERIKLLENEIVEAHEDGFSIYKIVKMIKKEKGIESSNSYLQSLVSNIIKKKNSDLSL